MKLQSGLACSLLCLCFSSFTQAQEPLQAETKLGAAKALSSAVLALNGISKDGDSPEFATLPSAPEPMLTPQPIAKQSQKPKIENRASRSEVLLWKGLAVAEHSAAVFDAWSTRQSLTSGNGYERDPLMKPFANSAAIYPVLQIAPFGADYLSHRFMRSNHVFLRRVWWIPQVASISGSMWCGARNLRVADLRR